MGLEWDSNETQMGLKWDSNGNLMTQQGLKWQSHGTQMGFKQDPNFVKVPRCFVDLTKKIQKSSY